MAFKLAISTLRWREPDLEPCLAALKEAGWEGWECRLPLDWLGTPQRVRRICENVGLPMIAYTAGGSPDDRTFENVERNRRRMEFAAEMGVGVFMYMNGRKPEDRPVTRGDIKAAAEGAEMWANYAAQFGLELSYHIHTNLLVDSSEDWAYYMGLLDKAKLCIDVSHAQLWGYDPVQSLRDFQEQLNYVHLQDYAFTSRREDGFYAPVWCDVGEYANVDFPAVRKVLAETNYDGWVTSVPGVPIVAPLEEAKRSKATVDYLRGIGF